MNLMDAASIEQDPFRESRLSAVDVRADADVPGAR